MGRFLISTTKKDKLMSSTNYNPTRGMRDFLPTETLQREKVLNTIQNYYKVNGFLPINTPIVESTEFLSKGNENSENAKLGFGVMSSKSSNENATLGLRYDLTVPLARFYAANKQNLPSPFRALQVGDVFRAERPQRGRYRQFLQCDIDVLGDTTIMAEMDVLGTSLGLLKELGLKQVTLNINDKSFLVILLTSYGFAEVELPEVIRLIDKLDKVPSDKIRALLEASCEASCVDKLFRDIEKIEKLTTVSRLEYFKDYLGDSFLPELITQLTEVEAIFNPFLARGMDYYTGVIFEVKVGEDNLSVAAGGRYDNFKGNISAVGMSLGFERIIGLIPTVDELRDKRCLLVYSNKVSLEKLFLAKKGLISKGYMVALQPAPKNLTACLNKMSNLYGNFVILNEDTEDIGDIKMKQLSLV